MVWTTIPNGDVDADSPITTALMTALRDNPAAIANGDTGAPEIQTAAYAAASVDQTALAANSVGQSEVKTTFQQQSGTADITATGGIYTIGHTMQGDDTPLPNEWWDYNLLVRMHRTDTATYLSRWRWLPADPGDNDNVRLYYINSSPPYDLGDGQIPLFIYAMVDNANSEIVSLNFAPDPIWVYNGPTNCVPTRYDKQGRAFRKMKNMAGHPRTFEAAKAAGGLAIAEYVEAFNAADWIEEEITQAVKNADQNLIPHPWAGNPPEFFAGKSLVMLDPVSDDLWKLLEFTKHKEADLSDLIRNYWKIGNTNLPRSGPNGLKIVAAGWK